VRVKLIDDAGPILPDQFQMDETPILRGTRAFSFGDDDAQARRFEIA